MEQSVKQQVESHIDIVSKQYGEKVSTLIDKSQPDPFQMIRCPQCLGEFLPREADLQFIDGKKVATDIETSISKQLYKVANMVGEAVSPPAIDVGAISKQMEDMRELVRATEEERNALGQQLVEYAPVLRAMKSIQNIVNIANNNVTSAMENREGELKVRTIMADALDSIQKEILEIFKNGEPS